MTMVKWQSRLGGILLLSLAALCLTAPSGWSEEDAVTGQNRLKDIRVSSANSLPIIEIESEMPVGYRYTVYDSYDPVRIIVDLPGMEVAAIQSPQKVDSAPLKEIRTGAFDLASGHLGRIELLLTKETKYKVASEDNIFSITFLAERGENRAEIIEPTTAVAGSEIAPPTKPADSEPVAIPAAAGRKAAQHVTDIQVENGKITLLSDGVAENFQYFHLRSPLRLVVDVYGVKTESAKRKYQVSGGFRQMRVGIDADKTRFVLDVDGQNFPEHKVFQTEDGIVISWAAAKEIAQTASTPAQSAPAKTSGATATKPISPAAAAKRPHLVAVEGVDFKVDGAQSILTIGLSAGTEIAGPEKEGDLVQFTVKNATIHRSHRRTIDASAFPSAVKLITPYSAEGGKEVRFSAQLKGEVPYALQQKGDKVYLVVENQEFAEPAAEEKTLVVPVPTLASSAENVVAPTSSAAPIMPLTTVAAQPAVETVQTAEVPAVSQSDAVEFSGEKISLVFDDANIRNILQLIGEVSNLNIIAAEDVKGSITLRLIDVPWDQALNLILETKGLGMLREGNVVRILPKDQIRAMRQAELTAVKEERQLESVITEVIPVSYTALNNISTPAKELLTDRGKITEDARNKQIIITDIPSVIADIKKLAGILDTPERQVMIEARIVEASSSFGRDLGVKWGLSYNNPSPGNGDINNANIGLGGSFLISPPDAGSVMGGAGFGSGITFGRVGIDSVVLDLRISALESAGYGKVISTPRVSTLNGGSASISQGTKIPYQSSGTDGLPKTEFVDANLQLTVQPVINPDDSIILDISATNSSIGSTVSTGGGTAPAIDTKEAKTKVLVRNGETTVIGGIFVETENTSNAGVPLLMDIPIIGHLFRSDNKGSTRSELLIFITPRIVQ
ncbi:MAG: type IV pilus secretin PilQ [Saccharofermentanales bacterium]